MQMYEIMFDKFNVENIASLLNELFTKTKQKKQQKKIRNKYPCN